MIFTTNLKFCLHLVLRKIRPEITMIDVLRNRDVFLDCKKDHFLKSKKAAFFKGFNPWFLSNISVFPYLIWVLNMGRNNAE